MAQCQSNPDGQCTLEPHCLPGECYLYGVALKEHTKIVAPDPAVARALADERLAYRRGPYTEGEPWDRTKLDLLNAVLDTVIPGARLVVEAGNNPRVFLGKTQIHPRPRDLAHTLRELADSLKPSH